MEKSILRILLLRRNMFNINIFDMLNKSRGDIAYTIIDIEGELDESISEKLLEIKGIKSVRVIG